MKQYTDLLSPKSISNLKIFSLISLFLYCLSIEKVQSDSTFFPDDTKTTDDVVKKDSDAIKEWAELTPPKKEIADAPLQKKTETIKESLPEPPSLTSEKNEEMQKQNPMPEVATEPKATTLPAPEKQEPLQLTAVEPRPKPLPIHEKGTVSLPSTEKNVEQKTVASYSDIANDRKPLGILEPTQEVQNQKWYIYASTIRGLKNPSDTVQVVSMEGSPPHRGEEIKALLIENGVETEKIQLIQATGEPHQTGFTYIFGGK